MRMTAAIAGASVLVTLGVHTTADTPASAVVNACHVSPIVEDLDRTARFYHELLGMDLMPPPPPGPLPVDTDPGHLRLHGMPGARLRFIQARIPGVRCGIELVELTGVDRRPVQRRYQDPGSITLVLTVRDLDAALIALKKDRVPIVTTGGAPVNVTDGRDARAITVQDPDGHYVELVQPLIPPVSPWDVATPARSNVIDIGLRVTVASVDDAVAFYRRLFGADGIARGFEKTPARLALAGLPSSAEFRSGFAAIPIPLTSRALRVLEFVEFRGAGSRAAAEPSRVQDPGSYRLQLTFRNIEATLAVLQAGGRRTISTSGVPVRMTFGGSRPWQLAIVPDPSNLFLIVQEAPQ
jgi:catechol 2,3-dioxygenase-like lactoylglutathione lyase family enzyme